MPTPKIRRAGIARDIVSIFRKLLFTHGLPNPTDIFDEVGGCVKFLWRRALSRPRRRNQLRQTMHQERELTLGPAAMLQNHTSTPPTRGRTSARACGGRWRFGRGGFGQGFTQKILLRGGRK